MSEISGVSEIKQSPEMYATTELTVVAEYLLRGVEQLPPQERSGFNYQQVLSDDGMLTRRMHSFGMRLEATTAKDTPAKIAYSIVKDYSTESNESRIFTWDTETAVTIGANDRHGNPIPDRSGPAHADQITSETKSLKDATKSVETRLRR